MPVELFSLRLATVAALTNGSVRFTYSGYDSRPSPPGPASRIKKRRTNFMAVTIGHEENGYGTFRI